MLSIVIPTLNAGGCLATTVAALAGGDGGGYGEIVISDGGSTDETRAVALAAGARVVEARRGRGTQLAIGAAAARGDWLLFLHADTRLEPGWATQATGFMADRANASRAAAFAFALDDPDPRARRLERAVAWRCRVLGLPYGDQGMLIGRGFYEELGGYRPIPLMEDVDLVRRIGRARLTMLPARAVTSAERWRRDGWYRRSARNLACLSLWYLGVPPATIARFYR